MSSPMVARSAGEKPALRPRDYGHLQRLAAHYAQARLAGRSIINRATGRRIRFDWPQGLRGAIAPGTPPELLLAVPFLPALLAEARPLGASGDPRRRHDVRRVHGFAASAEVAGRPIALWLVAREDRDGGLAFDGIVPQSPVVAPREDGGELPDLPGARTRALRMVLTRAAPMRRQDGGETSNEGTESETVSTVSLPSADISETPEASTSEASDGKEPGFVASAEPRVPFAFWESLAPGDEQDAERHGYPLEEWQALQRGEAWTPPQQPSPSFFERLGRDVTENAERGFGGNYGLSPEVYQALGGDKAVLTRWITQPLAKALDLLGNPNRGPAFALETIRDVPAEAAYSLGLVGSPERAKGELGALATAVGVVAGAHGPETAPLAPPSVTLPDLWVRTPEGYTPLRRLPRGSAGGPNAEKPFSRSQNDKPEGTPCIYCGVPTTRAPGPNRYNGDHIIPSAQGGNNSDANHADSCEACNRDKGNRTPRQWYKAGPRRLRRQP